MNTKIELTEAFPRVSKAQYHGVGWWKLFIVFQVWVLASGSSTPAHSSSRGSSQSALPGVTFSPLSPNTPPGDLSAFFWSSWGRVGSWFSFALFLLGITCLAHPPPLHPGAAPGLMLSQVVTLSQCGQGRKSLSEAGARQTQSGSEFNGTGSPKP